MKANLLSCLLRFQQTFRSGSAERDRAIPPQTLFKVSPC